MPESLVPRIIIFTSFFAVFIGCATTERFDTRLEKRTQPPTKNFLNKWSQASAADLETLKTGEREQNIFWWKTYRLGQIYSEKEKVKACMQFNLLAQDIEFPLHNLALLRSHQVCPANKENALPAMVNSWYRDLYIDIKLSENEDLPTLLEKARQESNLRKKEAVLQKALDKAKQSQDSSLIASTQKLLFRIAPRFLPNPQANELISVAQDFRSHRDFDKTLATYKKIIKNPNNSIDEKYQALKGLRQTFKIMERKNDYLAATAELVNWTKKQFNSNKKDSRSIMHLHDAEIMLARASWTEGQTPLAVATLNETMRLLKDAYPMDEVYFIQGRIEEEKGNLPKSIDYYDASYKEKTSLAGLPDKLLWLKAWNSYKLKKYDLALATFQQMKDKVKDPSDKARATFWLARCYAQKNQVASSQQELLNLSQQDPLGYYGLLSYRELKKEMPAMNFDQQKTLNLSLLNLGEVDSMTRLTVEWLIAAEEKSFVEKILNQVVDDLKKKNITREDTWLTMSSAFARSGLYLPLFSALGTLQPNVKDQLINNHPDLLFPLPYQDLISEASKKSGTPESFIYSIIRQESAFNPEARSPVDALGLMQLLPSVAKNIAKENKIPYAEPDDLFKPEINLLLGAFELKRLAVRYRDQFILAAAAYNASGAAIKGWVQRRYRSDPVEFIEEIPYEETRAYIKLVMRNYAFYERLLNKNHSTPFPEKLMMLLPPISQIDSQTDSENTVAH